MVLGEAKLIRSAVRPFVSTDTLLKRQEELRLEPISAQHIVSLCERQTKASALRVFSQALAMFCSFFLYPTPKLYAEWVVESSF